ncbi:MAG: SPASM domain-containing protein [Terracidiphilus sp.]
MTLGLTECTNCGPGGKQELSPQPYQPDNWEIAFVQDCNLRCGYCYSGHGRLGRRQAVMDAETSSRLVDLIAQMSSGRQQISVLFGAGETFLYFDQAIAFLDALRKKMRLQKTSVNVLIPTNGTLATEAQLQACLERHISLTFSIDGEAAGHDRFRKTAAGEPTHHIALKNWRRYREMVAGLPDGPDCNLYSVVTAKNRLAEVTAYWREQGVTSFKAVPAQPPTVASAASLAEARKFQAEFLADMEQLALSASLRLRGRPLAEVASAPSALVRQWKILSRSDSFSSCGAGYTSIGVDAVGNLYPCLLFIGHEQHILGNLSSGLEPAKVAAFREARARANAACSQCWARFLCHDGCCASDPEAGVSVNARGECEFMRSFSEIAIRSYQSWCDGRPSDATKVPATCPASLPQPASSGNINLGEA